MATKAATKTKIKPTAGLKVKVATQINVTLDNVPGELGRIAEALAAAGVNIEGICRTGSKGEVVTEHMVVDKVEAAKKAIGAQGKDISTEEVLAFHSADSRPGVVAMIAHTLGEARINIENMYASAERGKSAVVYVSVARENFKRALEVARTV
ncbi:MAG: hypothetical protein AAB538_01595 [Patescibacteria group bacterium]